MPKAVKKVKEPIEAPKKPLILCDVGGTLLLDEGWQLSKNPNQALITFLNHVREQGFEIRLCTGGYDTGTWAHDQKKLQKTNLDPEIINNVCGKNGIGVDTYSGVVAIIDDENSSYIRNVITGNHDAKYFKPDQITELTRHLNLLKSKGSFLEDR